MRKLLKKQGWAPTRIVTDKLRSYHVAFKELGLRAEHFDDKRANIGRRTLISLFGVESENCRSLKRQAQLKDF
jgi:transposase-like protein